MNLHELEEMEFGRGPRLWDADPDVCCAAFQLGACEHTEAADLEYEIDHPATCAYVEQFDTPDGYQSEECGRPRDMTVDGLPYCLTHGRIVEAEEPF
jgi:hypothetical protein